MGYFDANPAVALDELLRGVANVAPYDRSEPADLLALLFSGVPPEHPRRQVLDETLAAWLLARRQDGPEVRRQHGLSRYTRELVQALSVVYLLRLEGTAGQLRERLDWFQQWLSSLCLAPSRDPGAELWRVMALLQPDRRFLEEWYRLCSEAERSLPGYYLDIGLLGLRRLPAEDGSEPCGPSTELLAGLFRWAVHLPPGEASRKAFQRRLRALMALYPQAPPAWRSLIRPLLDQGYRDAPFLSWIEGAGLKLGGGGKTNGRVPHLPPHSRREKLLERIGREPLAQLLPEIRALLADYERYAEATGEDDFFVKSASHLGDRLKDRSPAAALELARAANRWRPSDERAWILWAEALVRLDRKAEAEAVYWEAVRRFPENAVCRHALAFLLVQLNRLPEAEELLAEIRARRMVDDYTRVLSAAIAKRRDGDLSEVAMPEGTYSQDPVTPSLIAEPRAADLEVEPLLQVQAEVSRADLALRMFAAGPEREQALGRLRDVLAGDGERVYPRVVLALREEGERRALVEGVKAFPHAYPLRFLAARASGTAESWAELAAEFRSHYPLTVLGRLASANGGGEGPEAAGRLQTWIRQDHADRDGFEQHLAERLSTWLFAGNGEVPAPATLRQRVEEHRSGIETLVADGLKRAADEHARIGGREAWRP